MWREFITGSIPNSCYSFEALRTLTSLIRSTQIDCDPDFEIVVPSEYKYIPLIIVALSVESYYEQMELESRGLACVGIGVENESGGTFYPFQYSADICARVRFILPKKKWKSSLQ